MNVVKSLQMYLLSKPFQYRHYFWVHEGANGEYAVYDKGSNFIPANVVCVGKFLYRMGYKIHCLKILSY